MPDTQRRAIELAVAAGREAGFEVEGAVVLRNCTSVLVELPRAGVVARVELLGGDAQARRLSEVARYFERVGAPTLRLLHVAPPVTLWPKLDAVADIDACALGQLLRSVHDRTRGAASELLPALDPFGEIAQHLDQLDLEPAWSADDRQRLRSRDAELAQGWRACVGEDPLGVALVHGDVHRDNVIVTAQGPVLIDLELAGVGPATWDFVQLGAAVHRYGDDGVQLEAFVRGYGDDPRGWAGYELLRDVYELLCAVWAAAYRSRSTVFAREATRRIDSLLGRGDQAWTLL